MKRATFKLSREIKSTLKTERPALELVHVSVGEGIQPNCDNVLTPPSRRQLAQHSSGISRCVKSISIQYRVSRR